MISAITNRGKVRLMLYRETMTSKVLIKFMPRLVKDAERKVFLILDNLRTHHSKDVKPGWRRIGSGSKSFTSRRIRLNTNPDEYLNGDLKDHIRSGLPARSEKE